jgi:cysteine desulfurase/selenocysteine lyase
VKLVSVQHASNNTGCVLPIKEITEMAHDNGSLVLVDGAQAAPHVKVDLNDLDVDFYCMSVLKMLGPSGMGVMYGKKDALEKLRPLCLGGGTVGLTTYDHVDLAPIPDRFEAGLQNYSGIAGTKAALEYLDNIGMDKVKAQDDRLMKILFEKTEGIKGLRMIGPEAPAKRLGVFSFNIDGLGSHDVAMMVDNIDGIMIRSGMHCAHPFYMSREIDGSARASVYLYNNEQDIDRFADALKKVAETFGDHRSA